ncbi:MAG: ergothioneine biosynthesis protein EgtB [Chloroflexi bacterium]|nr:ergothioneine biosynthesis protein EgtB [Chloroflexota bacterium]
MLHAPQAAAYARRMMSTVQPSVDSASLVEAYSATRQTTEDFSSRLAIEDHMLQAMDDVSPNKWHLAHVTWFFETFLLKPHLPGYQPINDSYEYLFNSYYNGIGPQYSRPARGQLSRPTVAEVYEYRRHVDAGMISLLEQADPRQVEELAPLVVLGINHEQQHQELMVTDLKYNLSINPLKPAYHNRAIPRAASTPPLRWTEHHGGITQVGWDGSGFAFDHESPRHDALLHPHQIASRLVTNGEFLEFMHDGGYERHDLWLAQGWATVQDRGWNAPLYWELIDGQWWYFTMSGIQKVDEHGPVVHVSYLEADAFATWSGKRLPTEYEWEHHAAQKPIEGNFADSGLYHPVPIGSTSSTSIPAQMYGDVWEWTSSAFLGYPGYKPLPGAIGEYNGKFMMSQMVLRGGSCATPQNHMRTAYRNFFYPPDRWQFKGLRLADDLN